MESKIGTILDKSTTKKACAHHWVIESPEKATSKGVCKLCGQVKIFENIIEELVPGRENKDSLNLDNIVDTGKE